VSDDALIAQLITHEGRKRFAYMDTVGKVTVGVGRNLSDKGLSDDEILYLLNNDIDECVADLATFPWFAKLDAIRQRVMLDFRFNVGPKGLRGFPGLLRALEKGDYIDAAKHLRDSLWYRQVKTRGVRLVQMMRTGQEFQEERAQL
jgi:lysozyme